jgi:hypothetical protein
MAMLHLEGSNNKQMRKSGSDVQITTLKVKVRVNIFGPP